MPPSPFTAAELARLRADTPAHGRYAHFAHGSASLPPRPVYEIIDAWYAAERMHGMQRAAEAFEEELAAARAAVAALIHARAEHIVFSDAASRAWALAFAAACDGNEPLEVICCEHEWGANVINLLRARAQGRLANLHVLADDGAPWAEKIRDALRQTQARTRVLVCLPAVAMIDGRLLDLQGVADAAHARDALFFLDASHAVGQFPIDMARIGCDALVFPARKWLRGPKGAAVLALSERALAALGAPPSLDIGSAQWDASEAAAAHADARRFELYEHAPALRLGAAAAATYATRLGLERIAAHNRTQRAALRQRLRDECGLVTLSHAEGPAFLTYALSPTLPAERGPALIAELAAAGINASLITPQYTRWALEARGLTALLRLTPHYITGEEEVERLVAALREVERDAWK
ncbi:MAG TPA: aminotransferase class V-fold PLP-dependent enzyme [Burkholderiales bacterium]